MSDSSISIVPKQSTYPGNTAKAKEILDWLIARNIVKPNATDCTLGAENGYAVSDGARQVVTDPEMLPFDLTTNGLEVVTERQVFHTGGNGMEAFICPHCNENIAEEEWNFFDEWQEQKNNSITCPLCNTASDIHTFIVKPDWGFSNLGFTFWNWGELTDSFIDEFRQKLDCDVSVV